MYRKHTTSVIKHLDFLVFDLLVMAVSFVAACLIRNNFGMPANWVSLYTRSGVIILILYLLVAIISRAYKSILQRNKWIELWKVFIQFVITFVLFVLYLFLVKEPNFSRSIYIMTGVIGFVLVWCYRVVWKYILRMRLARSNKLPQMLIIVDDAVSLEYVQSIKLKQYNYFRVKGIVITDRDAAGESIEEVPVLCNFSELKEYLLSEVVDEIFICMKDNQIQNDYVKYFLEMGITVHIGFLNSEMEYPNVNVEELGGHKVITTGVSVSDGWRLFIKRIADIIGGIVGVIITGILYLFLAPQIKKADPGPAFFKQTRIGKNGRQFEIYKFRSMYMDAEERKAELMAQNEMKGHIFKMENDPRILPGIGKKIRDSSLDEFPQFWNVLKGDMSLVGTRPPTPEEYSNYEAHHKMRLSFKPGITGLWQVSGRNRITDFEEIVELDNQYIREWGLWLDLKILLKTFKVVFKKDGSM